MAIPEGDLEYGWKARKREHRKVDRNQWKELGGIMKASDEGLRVSGVLAWECQFPVKA